MFSIARTNFAARLSCVALSRSISVILLSVVFTVHAFAQESPTSHTGSITPLSELLVEAEKNNPQIEAVRQGWQAAKQVPTQVSTLPDPQFNLQHVSVGSPRPFAGYTNSDFAYLGLGVSQDIPYPVQVALQRVKLRNARSDLQQQVESVRRVVLAEPQGPIFPARVSSPKHSQSSKRDGERTKQANRRPKPGTVPAWERNKTCSRHNSKKPSCFAKWLCIICRSASSKPSSNSSSTVPRNPQISRRPISRKHLSCKRTPISPAAAQLQNPKSPAQRK